METSETVRVDATARQRYVPAIECSRISLIEVKSSFTRFANTREFSQRQSHADNAVSKVETFIENLSCLSAYIYRRAVILELKRFYLIASLIRPDKMYA